MNILKIVVGLLSLGVILYVADEHWPKYFADPIATADQIIVNKSDRELIFLAAGRPIATYHVSLAAAPGGLRQVREKVTR